MKKLSAILAVLAVGLMVSGCVTTATKPPIARTLPPADQVVLDPAPRPVPEKGGDARVLARRALDYGDQNAARLKQSRETYRAVADELGRAK